jgi:peptidoglycan/xylan/chitin deacetylase (PgdA/CDA1 family)
MSDAGIVFLMYHELAVAGRSLCHREPGYTRYVVTDSHFRSQMKRLASEGLRGVSLSQALGSWPAKTVCITFDDGCETDVLSGAPALKEAGFDATFYITMGFVGKPGYLSSSQLRELNKLGFEIGCHSLTHPYLTDVDDARLHEETTRAKEQLEQMIGVSVEHFSCPGGRWNSRVAQAVKAAKFQSMATSRTAMNFPNTDRFALARVAVRGAMGLEEFMRACRGQGLMRTQLREIARGTAKRVLGNSAYDSLRALILGHDQSSEPSDNQ